MIRKFLLLVLALSFLGAEASVITQTDSITLSPEQKSQTISIGLNEVPSNLFKKGILRDGKVKLKFKLAKKDRKKFTLDPKNGKLTINIVDGIIQPASLIVTANEETELGTYNYKILTNKKFRKTVTKKKDSLEYNNVKTITGQIDLSNIVTTASLRDGIDPSGLVVEIYDFDAETKALGELIAQTTSDIFGGFTAEMPSDKVFGPRVFCQATLPDETKLKTFVTNKEPVINAQSDYFVNFINSSDIDLVQIPDVDFAAMLEQVARENIIATTVQGVQDKADDIYNSTLNKFAEGNKGNAELPGAFKGFSAKFLLGQAFTGNDDENNPIIGQVSGFSTKIEKAKVDAEQDAVFEVPAVGIGQYGVVIIDPINDPEDKGQAFFSPSIKTGKEAQADDFVYKTFNPKDNCLIMTTPPLTLDPEKGFFTNKSSVIYDAIFEEEAGLIAGTGAGTARDNDGEGDLLSSTEVVLPLYVQNTSDLNGTSNKQRSLADFTLSTIITIGYGAVSIDYSRIGIKKAAIETAICAATDGASREAFTYNCNKGTLVELNVSKEGDDQNPDQYLLDADLILAGTEEEAPLDIKLGEIDWGNIIDVEKSAGFTLSNNAKEKADLKKSTDLEADLVLKPLFGDTTEAGTRSEVSGAFKFKDIILSTDFINTDNAAHATVQFIYDMTNSGNGTALKLPTTYKTYGVSFEFDSDTSSINQITGSALVTPSESNNSVSWKIVNEAYEKNTSSLSNTNINNLAPSKSTDSVADQVTQSVYNASNSSHVFESIHGTTRQCQFPNDQIFVCQIFSSNTLDDSNTDAKSVGLLYGVRVENQVSQE